MQSRAEQTENKRPGQRLRDVLSIWNRRAHYYLGLYFLFFLWLFALTGLLLNHSWSFAAFWPNRKVSRFDRDVKVSSAADDFGRARAVMQQLGVDGEIEWTLAGIDSPVFSFRAGRPGRTWQVTLNPELTRAAVEQTDINGWGVMRVLHTFTGVRTGDDRNDRDWILTTVWALSMDAVAVGLAVLVVSGLYIWIGLPPKRRLGTVALLAGSLACAVFVVGLRLIY